MSELESEILRRIQEQKITDEAEVTKRLAREALDLERQHDEDARMLLSLKAGQEVVALLMKYKIPSKKIWEQKVVGKKPYQGFSKSGSYNGYRDVSQYFNTARGWHIYTHSGYDPDIGYSSSRAALTEAGRAITFEREIGYFAVPRHDDKGNKTPVAGIVHPCLLPANHTLQLLEGDDFQNDIASLIRGNGPAGQ